MAPVLRLLPFVTTLVAALFGTAVLQRFLQKPVHPHLGWWAAGIYLYGIGTLSESVVSMIGWHPEAFRLWYAAGALLGSVAMAQGTAYFHLERRAANRVTTAVMVYLMVVALLVAVVPLRQPVVHPHRLSGSVVGWGWVRQLILAGNLYATVVLALGAVVSAVQARRRAEPAGRVPGNLLIAAGAVLLGAGAVSRRLGHLEVLYVLELIGLAGMWLGYRLCILR